MSKKINPKPRPSTTPRPKPSWEEKGRTIPKPSRPTNPDKK